MSGVSSRDSLADVLGTAMAGGYRVLHDENILQCRLGMCAKARRHINSSRELGVGTRCVQRDGALADASDEEHYDAQYERAKDARPLLTYWHQKLTAKMPRLKGGVRLRIYCRLDGPNFPPEIHDQCIAADEDATVP